jgi:hypothetical protein
MSTLKVPGAQLSYEVSGSGPLLILIPGASGAGEVFRVVQGGKANVHLMQSSNLLPLRLGEKQEDRLAQDRNGLPLSLM